jgi:hypothetical protein
MSTPKTYKYMMRAEALADVYRASRVIPIFPCAIECPSSMCTDAIVSFDSEWTLPRLCAALAFLPDGHVMAETVALTEDYTGERK